MERTAQFLGRRAAIRKGLGRGRAPPFLLFFTDPVRTPQPEAIVRRLPRGTGVVFRAFGAADADARGLALAAVARARGLVLLVGADDRLAARIGAAGVHLPERLAHRARRLKAAHPRWIVTAAAHSARAVRQALAYGADAVAVSAVFESRSASAGAPLGALRLAILARRAGGPVIGLGGVDNKKARLLKDTGLAGLAAVDAFGDRAPRT
ncbi:MAG: thiamine monophosphate synthase [Phenylobacterium sp.]|nr:MAG: thiamine monophosphate synthase [Phenylobacterium sp.]